MLGSTLKIQNSLFPPTSTHAMSAKGSSLMGAAGGGGGGGGGGYKSFVDPDAPAKGL